MDALLILTAIVLMVIAWGWLIISSLRLPLRRLVIAVLLPFVTLLLHDRGYARTPRVLLVAGLICGLAGLGMLYQGHPERFHALISGSWLDDGSRQTTLEGAIMGQPFRPDRAHWRGSELHFEEGPADRIRRSIAIRFNEGSEGPATTTIERLPGDDGNWPELVLQWHGGALQAPGLRKVNDDYSLSVSFLPAAGDSVAVQIHMHLLPAHATWLRGHMNLASTPTWLADRFARKPADSVTVIKEPPAKSIPLPAPERRSHWDEISLLALLDEPQHYVGARVRLTTSSGRSHEGVFKGVTDAQRIILAQPRGANQVDLQFGPADLQRVESHSLR